MGLFDFLRSRPAPSQDEPVDTEPDASPGLDAIRAVGASAHPDNPEPITYAALIKARFGGPDPLDLVDVYRGTHPEPHWHYVTCGFSDLYGEGELYRSGRTDGPSDFGFELTVRLADPQASDPEAMPPQWVLVVLQSLARYVFETGNVFRPDQHVDLQFPLNGDEACPLTAGMFVLDPELGAVDTPTGQVVFTQFVGLTNADLMDLMAWSVPRFAELYCQTYPLGLTHLYRPSLGDDAKMAAALASGQATEGSSMGPAISADMKVSRQADGGYEIKMPASEAAALHRVLQVRAARGLRTEMLAPHAHMVIEPVAEGSRIDQEGEVVTLWATEPVVAALMAAVSAGPGRYPVEGVPLSVTVEPG